MSSAIPPRMLGVYASDPEVAQRDVRWAASLAGNHGQTIQRRTIGGTLSVLRNGSARRPLGWADQPDGSFAVVDGEFYSDDGPSNAGEPVLSSYERGGLDALGELDGKAAVALWDERTQQLLLFRDRDGLSPLFFVAALDALYWATDLPSLIPLLADREIDRSALDFLLAEGYVPSPLTLIRGISRLPAGEVLIAPAPQQHRLETYARYSGRPKVRIDKATRTRRFGELFERSVRQRSEGDRSTGVLVSGGIDSTLILAMLTRVIAVSPRAYTFRYEAYSGWKNESEGAIRAASHLGVPHEEVAISARDIGERATDLIRQHGEPFTFGLHSYQLGPLAADGIEVLFSGQGRDYLMSRTQILQARYGALPLRIRQALDLVPKIASPIPRVHGRLRSIFDGVPSWGARLYGEEITPAALRASLYTSDHLEAYRRSSIELLDSVAEQFRDEQPLERLLLPGQRLRASDLYTQWHHWWAQARDISVRQPFRDRRLLHFLFSLKGLEVDKQEQRRFAATLLPHAVAFAPKLHQLPPLQEWLREGGPLLAYARDQLSDDRVRASGLFDPAAVRRLLDEHAAARRDHEWTIWVLIGSLIWQEHVLSAAPTIVV